MRPALTFGAIGLALVVSTATAAAQSTVVFTPDFDPDRFVLTSDPDAIGLTESARPLAAGRFAAGLAFRAGGAPLRVCVESMATGDCTTEGQLVSGRFGADLAAAVGFGRFGLHLQVPVVLYQGSDFQPGVTASALSAAAFGDLRVGGKLRLAQAGAVAVGWDLTASLPTGGGDNFVGDAGTVIENRLLADARRGKLAGAAGLGYAWRSQAVSLGDLYVDDEVVWSVAAGYQVQPRLTAGLALFGRIGVHADPDPVMAPGGIGWGERPAEAMASAVYRLSPDLAIEAGAGTALDTGYGAPPFRVLAGLRWSGARNRRAATPAVEAPVVLAVAPTEPPVVARPSEEPPPVEPPPAEEPPVEEPPPADAPVVTIEDDHLVIPDRIHFASGSSTIAAESTAVLDAVAELLRAHATLHIRIEGHTDARAGASWNKRLSQQRADAVRTYLVGAGIAGDRLEAVGYGEEHPLQPGRSAAAMQANRRVEFVIVR